MNAVYHTAVGRLDFLTRSLGESGLSLPGYRVYIIILYCMVVEDGQDKTPRCRVVMCLRLSTPIRTAPLAPTADHSRRCRRALAHEGKTCTSVHVHLYMYPPPTLGYATPECERGGENTPGGGRRGARRRSRPPPHV